MTSLKTKSFGQSESITNRLRNILQDYPRGTQIFRELLQNADDAKATEFKLVFDQRHHSKEKLDAGWSPVLQGPAILAYNNAVFEEKDFQSIQNLGQSRKRQDLEKTGRYGIGFNSVYHFTDVPCFVSAKDIVMLDPQRAALPQELTSNNQPGVIIDFTAQNLNTLPDQFRVFEGVFGLELSSKQAFQGTLFRFPLRTEEQSKLSHISDNWYNKEDVLGLFEKFIQEAADDILFLKHITHVSVYMISDEQGKSGELCRLYQVNVTYPQETDRFHRQKINGILKQGIAALQKSVNDLVYSYTLQMVEEVKGKESISNTWIISSCLEAGAARDFALKHFGQGRHMPYGAVALNVSKGPQFIAEQGRAYCFLPVPVWTGLPVQVNGFFELSSNRRELWKSVGEQLEGEAKLKQQWNELMKGSVLPRAFVGLFHTLIESGIDSSKYLPVVDHIAPEWGACAREIYRLLYDEDVKFLIDCKQRNTGPKKAVFLLTDESESPFGHAKQFLLNNDHLVVDNLSWTQVKGFEVAKKAVQVVSPAFLRSQLKSESAFIQMADVPLLLPLCLRDNNFKDLHGCKVIITAANTLLPLQNPPVRVYLCTEKQLELFSSRPEVMNSLCVDTLEEYGDNMRQICKNVNTNLALFDDSTIVTLLNVPSALQKQKIITWDEEIKKLYSEDFVQKFLHYSRSITDLTVLHRLHWIPVIPDKLIQYDQQKILRDSNKLLDAELVGLLSRIGLMIVDAQLFPIELGSKNVEFSEASFKVILQALAKYVGLLGDTSKVVKLFSLASSAQCESFIKLAAESNEMTNYPEFVVQLPIFTTFSGKRVSALSKLKLVPEGLETVIPMLDKEMFIKTDGAKQRKFAEALGLRECNRAELFLKYVLPKLETTEVDEQAALSITLYLLDNLSNLLEEEPTFLKSMKEKMIFRVGKKVFRARELYNPTVYDLKILLEGQSLFPHEVLCSGRYIEKMIALGLNNGITDHVLRKLINTVISTKDSSLAMKILSYLGNHNEWNNKHVKAVLEKNQENPWIPILVLPQSSSKSILEPSKVLPNTEDILQICGSTAAICAVRLNAGLTLAEVLGFRAKPTVDSVIDQLRHLSQMHDKGELIVEEATIATEKVYSWLEKEITTSNQQKLQHGLQEFKSIWVGDRFLYPKQLVLSSHVNLKPYIYEAPPNIAQRQELAKLLRLPASYGPALLVDVLRQLSLQTSEQSVQLACAILPIVSKFQEACSTPVMAPTRQGSFKLISELYYVDNVTVVGTLLESKKFNENMLHPDVSIEVAKQLGALSMSEYVACCNSELLGEEFGQGETLQNRIKNILRDYQFTHASIPKEMLQNAEDAGATEFMLVFDKRTHENKSLCSEKLSSFQGPALMFYNNATFTEGDIKGIQDIGGMHKLAQSDLIGRHSVGFNASYHLTDLPSILSGENYIILDPHAKYVAGATPSKPGRKYKFSTPEFLSSFPHQLAPFALMGVQDEPFSGTLIRLPLRTTEQAKVSELSDASWDEAKVYSLMREFKEVAPECLLFLRNVQKVTIIEIDRTGTKTLYFEVTSTKSIPLQASEKQVRDLITRIQQKRFKELPHNDEWFLGEKLLKRRTQSSEVDERWFILSYWSSNRTVLKMTESSSNNKARMIPFAQLACKIGSNVVEPVEGKLFSFLPIPQRTTSLPFHINAYFELFSNRAGLLQASEKSQKRSTAELWNEIIFKDIFSPAYVILLESLASLLASATDVSELDKAMRLCTFLEQFTVLDKFPELSKKAQQDYCIKELAKRQIFYCASKRAFQSTVVAVSNDQHTNEELQYMIEDGIPFCILPEHLLKQLKVPLLTPQYIGDHYHKCEMRNASSKKALAMWKLALSGTSKLTFDPAGWFVPLISGDCIRIGWGTKVYYISHWKAFAEVQKFLKGYAPIVNEEFWNEFSQHSTLSFAEYDLDKFAQDLLATYPELRGSETLTANNYPLKLIIYFMQQEFQLTKESLPQLAIVETEDGTLCCPGPLLVSSPPPNELKAIPNKLGIKKVKDGYPLSGLFPQFSNELLIQALQLKIDILTSTEKQTLLEYLLQRSAMSTTIALLETESGQFVTATDKVTLRNRTSPLFIPKAYKVIKTYGKPLDDLILEKLGVVLAGYDLYFKIIKCFETDSVEEHELAEIIKIMVLRKPFPKAIELIAEITFIKKQQPRYFCDPSHPLAKMLPESKQLPPQFCTKEWLTVLKNIGLRPKPDENEILTCARYVESIEDESAFEKAAHLFWKNADVPNLKPKTCETLMHMKLFLADRTHATPSNSSFKLQAAKAYDYPLMWCVFTQDPVVHKEFSNYFGKLVSTAQCPRNPPVQKMIAHLMQLSKLNLSSEDLVTCTDTLYKVLSSEELPASISLQEHAVIFVDGFMLKPSQMFLNIDGHYPPFIYKCSSKWVDLFTKFGVSSLPSEKYCKLILKHYRKSTKQSNHRLSSDDARLCCKVIQLLIEEYNSTLEGSFLVTNKNCIHPHRMVLVDDAPYLRSRFDVEQHFNILHPDLGRFAERLKMKRLSSAVNEQIVVKKEVIGETALSQETTELLSKKEFIAALVRLVAHSKLDSEENQNNQRKIDLMTLHQRIGSVKDLKILVATSLESVICNKITKEPLGSPSSGKTFAFLDQHNKTIYLHASLPPFIDYALLVATELNRYLESPLGDVSKLAMLLRCRKAEEFEYALDMLQIKSLVGAENEDRGIGAKVLADDRDLFSKSPAVPSTDFYLGEPVAFLDPTSQQLHYGKIHQQLDSSLFLIETAPSTQKKMSVTQLYKMNHLVTENEENNESKSLQQKLATFLECSISCETFADPVVLSDGYTYEKSYAKELLKKSLPSPHTRETLRNDIMIPNIAVRSIVKEFIDND